MAIASTDEIQAFYEELQESLTFLDKAIISLEENPGDKAQITEIFRVAHTVKGNAGFLGLQNLVDLGHAMESVFQEFQKGNAPISAAMTDLLLRCKDTIGNIGSMLYRGEDPLSVSTTSLIDENNSILLTHPTTSLSQPSAHSGQSHNIEYVPGASLLRVWISPQEVAPSVRAYLLEKRVSDLSEIIKVDPDEATREESDFASGDREIRFFIKTEIPLQKLPGMINIDLIERIEVIDEESLRRAAPANQVTPEKTGRKDIPEDAASDTVRIPVQRLDSLLNLVGELVIANSGLMQLEEITRNNVALAEIDKILKEKVKGIYRISSEIQELIMKSRLVPIGQVFSRFKRFTRDYSARTGKQIQLVITGEDTEIDKRIIDEIIKPLTHLVRNAADHGIETAEERVVAGKPMQGRLELAARQAGNFIIISVDDDGNGLDYDRIREKAITSGLLTAESAKSADERTLQEILFHPGFSTKDAADDISGRGYGMDVVRHSIEQLNGIIEIQSTRGKGSKVIIKLPLTLAIINALVILVAGEKFSIPMASITETLKIHQENILQIEGREMIRVRDSLVPLIRLDKTLLQKSVPFEKGEKKPVVIVEYGSASVGLLIDQFLSRHEMVIKSLTEHYRAVDGISGASILGNGEIILILDVHGIINLYKNKLNDSGSKERFRKNISVVTKGSAESKKQLSSDSAKPTVQAVASQQQPPAVPPENTMTPKSNEDPPMPSQKKTETPAQENEHGARSFHREEEDLEKLHKLFEPENKTMLREWIKQGNARAIQGIRMMTGTTDIKVDKSKGSHFSTRKIEQVFKKINRATEELIAFTLPVMPLNGEIDFILTKSSAQKMVSLLMNQAGLEDPGMFDAEPLMEVTNILGSAYTNSLTQLTDVSVEPGVPRIIEGAAAIQKTIEDRKKRFPSEILYVENEFQWHEQNITAELLIFLPGIVKPV